MGLRIGETKDDISPSHYKKMDKFKKLLKLLDEFCEEYSLPKKDIIIFGSAVLARNNLRDINNLNISVPSMQFKKLQNNPELEFESTEKDCSAVLTKDTLHFKNNECNTVKFSTLNKDTVLINGFKMISTGTWKEMQDKYLSDDKRFMDHPRLIK